MKTSATATVTDPVCGMTIDPARAVGSSSHDGETYHFCSRGCETKFDAAPAEYVGAGPAPAGVEMPARPGGHSCC